jgi:hypothetical protein
MPISDVSKMDVRQLFSELLGDGLMRVILRHAERQRKHNRENWLIAQDCFPDRFFTFLHPLTEPRDVVESWKSS